MWDDFLIRVSGCGCDRAGTIGGLLSHVIITCHTFCAFFLAVTDPITCAVALSVLLEFCFAEQIVRTVLTVCVFVARRKTGTAVAPVHIIMHLFALHFESGTCCLFIDIPAAPIAVRRFVFCLEQFPTVHRSLS